MIPPSFGEFHEIASIFTALIQIFEDPHTPLASVFPVIQNAVFALQELTDNGNYLASYFIASLENYTIKSTESGLWALAFLLTPKGRKEGQERIMNPQRTVTGSGYLKQFYVKKPSPEDALDEAIREISQDKCDEIIAEESDISLGLNDHEVSENFDLNQLREGEAIPIEIIDAEGENTNLIELENSLICYDDPLTVAAYNYFQQAIETIGCPKPAIPRYFENLRRFIAYNEHPFHEIQNLQGRICYDFLNSRISFPEWKFFSDLGLRLESCHPSEASCERTISAQRLILTCHTLRSEKRLLEARLTFMKSLEK
jgi:hypothetical protein